jgi:hypothetical protein
MTALVQDADISVGLTADTMMDRIPMLASGLAFVGSIITLDAATGYGNRCVAGQPFVGVAQTRVEAVDWLLPGGQSPVNGGLTVQVASGRGTARITLAAVQLDVLKRRKVYASDDATFTFSPLGNTLVGTIVGIINSTTAIIKWMTADEITPGPGVMGMIQYTDAALPVQLSDLDKLILAPITTARTYTLPLSADASGHFYTFISTGAFVLTISGNGGTEKIGNATTLALTSGIGHSCTLFAAAVAGSEWQIVSNQ